MKGRPRINSRNRALLNGEKRYHGAPCGNCGGTERYVANYVCVLCEALREKKKYTPTGERAAALERGDTHYWGTPCCHGHTGLRYAKTGQCAECRGVNIDNIECPIPITPEIKDTDPEPDCEGWKRAWGRFDDDPRACKRDHTRYTPRHPMVDAA